jgi:hypothetical protein
MRVVSLSYAVLTYTAAALLGGCGVSSFAPTQVNLYPGEMPPAKQHTRVASCPPCLYVANQGPPGVMVFPVGATGNLAPLEHITGTQTDLETPTGVAIDEKGNIYVSDLAANAILEFAAGATGNVKPKATITGKLTRLAQPAGVALDRKDNIYVSNSAGPGSIVVFASGSGGNVAPMATIGGKNTELSRAPQGLALDSHANIYVAVSNNYVLEFSAGSHGDVAPTETIHGKQAVLSKPTGIGIDRNANIYVSSFWSHIGAYTPGSHGDAPPTNIIGGALTGLGLLFGVALDANGNIYAVSQPQSSNVSTNGVYEFAKGSDGNVQPTAVLSGKKTLLTYPSAIAIR